MECPVCGNTVGFAFGTCVRCGYNHEDNTYHFIKVNTEILQRLVSEEIFNLLVSDHEKRFYKVMK